MEDLILTCIQCEAPFSFSVAEQKRCDLHDFDPPTRCPDCRKKKSKLYGNNINRVRNGKRREKRFTKQSEDY